MILAQIEPATAGDLGHALVVTAGLLAVLFLVLSVYWQARQIYLSHFPAETSAETQRLWAALGKLEARVEPLASEQAVSRKQLEAIEKLATAVERLLLEGAEKKGALERVESELGRLETGVQAVNALIRKAMGGVGKRFKRNSVAIAGLTRRMDHLERKRGDGE